MIIKNYSNSDLIFDKKGQSITLKADDLTLIPDGFCTIQELQNSFGKGVVALYTGEEGPTTSILDNQQIVQTGKLYTTSMNEGARMYVGVGGAVDVYGSDSTTIPSSFEDMSCPDENEEISGTCSFGSLPRYIAFKENTGNPEIVVTNCKLFEVKDLA